MLGGMILHWLYVAYTFCCGADFAAFAGASGMNLHAFASPKKAQSVREKNRSLSKKRRKTVTLSTCIGLWKPCLRN